MTASEIIEEIGALPLSEQVKVVEFVSKLDSERQLCGPELNQLARGLVGATDPLKVARLREALTHGFYGGKPQS